MADNSSNSVAIVAIVIIVLLALGGFYWFVNKGGLNPPAQETSAPTKIDINLKKPADNNQ